MKLHKLIPMHTPWLKLGVLLLGICFHTSLHAEAPAPLQIAIVNSTSIDPDDPANYYEQLLKLALEKTRKTDGDFVIVHKPNAEGVGGCEQCWWRIPELMLSGAQSPMSGGRQCR